MPSPAGAPDHSQLKMSAEAAPIKPKKGAVSELESAMVLLRGGLCGEPGDLGELCSLLPVIWWRDRQSV
jgi:hypothetical protein